MRSIVTVVGRDRVGIIAGVCQKLAEVNINILDISQTILSEYFTMMMLVDTTGYAAPFDKLSEALADYGEDMGLVIRIQREDIFEAMHRI